MAQRENTPPAGETDGKTKVVSAGAFDIRNIIGGLLGIYGLILTAAGLWFTSDDDKSKVDGENLNLTVGIGLIVFGVIFMAWVILRPLKVPVTED